MPAIDERTEITDDVLDLIAHLPTEFLPKLVAPAVFKKLTDAQLMRIAAHLAQKSYDEGGCPIGGVIVRNDTRQIIGKGHNTLGQENDSTTHGETAALRDAGRVAQLRHRAAGEPIVPVDFRGCTMFTTLTPCVVCCAQINNRCNFDRVVIGDVTNAPTTAPLLTGVGRVETLEDREAIALYKRYAAERPMLHFVDWGGWRKWSENGG